MRQILLLLWAALTISLVIKTLCDHETIGVKTQEVEAWKKAFSEQTSFCKEKIDETADMVVRKCIGIRTSKTGMTEGSGTIWAGAGGAGTVGGK